MNSVLHSKGSVASVSLELVTQESDQVSSYFIVSGEIKLKTSTLKKINNNGLRDLCEEYLP